MDTGYKIQETWIQNTKYRKHGYKIQNTGNMDTKYKIQEPWIMDTIYR